jgi:hypothetical protein
VVLGANHVQKIVHVFNVTLISLFIVLPKRLALALLVLSTHQRKTATSVEQVCSMMVISAQAAVSKDVIDVKPLARV